MNLPSSFQDLLSSLRYGDCELIFYSLSSSRAHHFNGDLNIVFYSVNPVTDFGLILRIMYPLIRDGTISANSDR